MNLFIQVKECLSVAWDAKFVKPHHHLPSVGSSCPLMTDLRHCVEASPHPHSWGIAPSCPAVGNKSFSPDFLWDKWQESNKKNCQDVKMLKPPNSCLFSSFVSYSFSKILLCDQEMKLLQFSCTFHHKPATILKWNFVHDWLWNNFEGEKYCLISVNLGHILGKYKKALNYLGDLVPVFKCRSHNEDMCVF